MWCWKWRAGKRDAVHRRIGEPADHKTVELGCGVGIEQAGDERKRSEQVWGFQQFAQASCSSRGGVSESVEIGVGDYWRQCLENGGVHAAPPVRTRSM